jgi:putative oxidoreductase
MRYETAPTNCITSRPAHAVLAALRVMAGLMLLQHGVQKWLGLLLPPDRPWNGAPELLSRPGFSGVLELAGGALLTIGLFARPVAFVLSGLMAFAYFLAHAPDGFWPILNGGELAALYCFVFLAFWAVGPGRYSVDAWLAARRRPALTVARPSWDWVERSATDRRRGAA